MTRPLSEGGFYSCLVLEGKEGSSVKGGVLDCNKEGASAPSGSVGLYVVCAVDICCVWRVGYTSRPTSYCGTRGMERSERRRLRDT